MVKNSFYRESGPFGCHLIRPVVSDDRLVHFQVQMLTRDRLSWMVPCYLRYQSGQPQICHDLSGLESLDNFYRADDLHRVNGIMLLRKLLSLLDEAEENLVKVTQIALHPSIIFCKRDVAGQISYHLVVWPVVFANPDADPVKTLIETLAISFKIPDDQSGDLIKLYHRGGVRQLLDFFETDTIRVPSTEPDAACRSRAKIELSNIVKKLIGPMQRLKEAISNYFRQIMQSVNQWLQSNAQEDQPLDNQTVLLPADPANFRMALISAGRPGTPEENEGLRAYILVDEFLIGRDVKACDLCLNEPGIGRQHARIMRRAGSFYICDLGSRNGTRLDGRRLLKNTEILMPDQCLLQFADQSFFFQAD